MHGCLNSLQPSSFPCILMLHPMRTWIFYLCFKTPEMIQTQKEGKARKECCLALLSIPSAREQTEVVCTKSSHTHRYCLYRKGRASEGPDCCSVYSLIHVVITVTPKILPIVKVRHDVISFLKKTM